MTATMTSASSPTAANHPANIRSGMTVQDLKMLTAQREYRIMMEQYNTTVGDPSLLATLTSPRSSRSMSLSLSDTSSSADGSPISSPVMSPQQHRSPFQPPPPPSMTLASLQQPPASKSHSHHYHHHHHHPSTSSYLRHGGRVEQRVLVTCGGQMVSVMEGVRNVPDDMMTYVEGSSSAASHF